MNKKLFLEAVTKYLIGLLLVLILVFLPAGTFLYWNGWLFICLLFIPMFILGITLIIKAPELLKARLNVKEKQTEQKEVVVSSALMFILGFIACGLCFRFNIFQVSKIIVIIASVIFIISYMLYAEILRENKFLLRTIEVQENQKVVDTGFYKVVRHPMYTITIFLFFAIPLILGSYIGFIIFLYYPFIIARRINNEEKVLEKDLKGYLEYKNKVKYKLIPFVW